MAKRPGSGHRGASLAYLEQERSLSHLTFVARAREARSSDCRANGSDCSTGTFFMGRRLAE